MVWQDKPPALLIGQPPFDEGKVKVFIAAIQFVAHQAMGQMGQVNADLMLASGTGQEAK